MPSLPLAPTACPAKANVPTRPPAKTNAKTFAPGLLPQRRNGAARIAANEHANMNRASQSRPNPVWRRTVQSTPSEKRSATEFSLMDWATTMNQAAPETNATASPIQTIQANCARKTAGGCASASDLENAGSAGEEGKKIWPTAV